MSEIEYNEYENDDEPEQRRNPVREALKQKEKEVSDLRKQVAELSKVQQELAFTRAGVDPTDPRYKYFVKGYDGEMTTEAIRAALEEAQLITPQSNVSAEDKAGWQQTNKIAAGADTAPDGNSWMKRIQDASSESELMSIFAEAQAQGIDLGEM